MNKQKRKDERQQLSKKREKKPLLGRDQKPPEMLEEVETARQQYQKRSLSVNTIYIKNTQKSVRKQVNSLCW